MRAHYRSPSLWLVRALGSLTILCVLWATACGDTPGPGRNPLEVVFTPSGGTFVTPPSVSLAADANGATVHYTLDGTLPSAASPVYEGPISLQESARLRAVAIVPGQTSATIGPVSAQTYLRVASDAAAFTSHLPIVVIHTWEVGKLGDNSDEPFVPATFQVFEPKVGNTGLVGQATLDTRIGIRVRGESSRGFPKKQYAVEFRDANEEDVDRPLLGMPAGSDWVMTDPITMDRSLIRNAFVYEVSNNIGRYAPRSRFVEAFLIDGEDGGRDLSMANFVGFFTVIEKIKRGRARLDLKKLSAGDLAEPDIGGGYILRIDKGDNDFGAAGAPVGFVYPKSEVMAQAERQPQGDYIRNFIDNFSAAANAPNQKHPLSGKHYSEFIDQDSWIDHHILNLLAKNPDALKRSAYFHKNETGKLVAGPVWDFDRTFGTPADSRATEPDGWRPAFDEPWWKPLFNDPAFQARYRTRCLQLLDNALSPARLEQIIDRLVLATGPAAGRNYARWPQEDIPGNAQVADVAIMKAFLTQRVAWIRAQMAIVPDFRN